MLGRCRSIACDIWHHLTNPPQAVVVHAQHAAPADGAVVRALRLPFPALFAPARPPDIRAVLGAGNAVRMPPLLGFGCLRGVANVQIDSKHLPGGLHSPMSRHMGLTVLMRYGLLHLWVWKG